MRSSGPSVAKGEQDGLELDPVLRVGRAYSVDVWIKLPAAGKGPFRTLLSSGSGCLVSVV